MRRHSCTSIIHSLRFKVTLIAFFLFLVNAVLVLKELINPDKKQTHIEWTFVAALGLLFVLMINSVVLILRIREAKKKG